jgi:hypothetical protein
MHAALSVALIAISLNCLQYFNGESSEQHVAVEYEQSMYVVSVAPACGRLPENRYAVLWASSNARLQGSRNSLQRRSKQSAERAAAS